MTRNRRTTLPPSPRRRLDPLREITIDYVSDGPARGWMHTHGLAAHGKPELEIRYVPVFLRRAACSLLNDVAGYLLNEATRPLLPGQTMLCGKDTILFEKGRPDEDAGFDPCHYVGCTRLALVDPPATRATATSARRSSPAGRARRAEGGREFPAVAC